MEEYVYGVLVREIADRNYVKVKEQISRNVVRRTNK